MHWSWLPTYIPYFIQGLGITLLVWVFSVVVGFVFAIPIALAQVTGAWPSRTMAKLFCGYIRFTPLLMQLYMLYAGIGSIFPFIPGMREHAMWLIRLDAIYYGLAAFTMSFAGYEAEIMRGAFLSVPRGELEAARAIGMSPWKVLIRVWLPRAVLQALPTLTGDVIGQLKSTPLIFALPVMDLMAVVFKVQQDTYIIYEPLIFLALIYMALTFITTRAFGYVEKLVPTRR